MAELINPWERGERAPEHRRNPRLEELLDQLNTYLRGARESMPRPQVPERPVAFIVGCARGGSTLLLQLLAGTGEFSYPTNILSRFYEDPYVGALVHHILYTLDGKGEIFPEKLGGDKYTSQLGKTVGANAPHEFNYLWRKYFKFGELQSDLVEPPDRDQRAALVSDLAALEFGSGKPVVMKAMELNWHLPLLRSIFPDSVFLFNQRDILSNAMSLMQARITHRGDATGWYSYKPEEYPELVGLPPWEQAVAQVWYTERAVQRGLAGIPENDVIPISYETLCRTPGKVCGQIWERMGIKAPYNGPECFHISGKQVPDELRERAEVLLQRLSGQPA